MTTIPVELGPRRYPIQIASGWSGVIGAFARSCAPKSELALIVTDENVDPHAEALATSLKSASFRTSTVILQPGEETKSLAWANELYDELAELNADRRTLVVALGGGVIGDLAGFAAATYNRGLPLFMVPTTLLSMVDSSVGGKVGINHERGKNLIGAFHQPAGVAIDLDYLKTLPERDFRSGLAEVVKYGVILDAEFFETLELLTLEILSREPLTLEAIVARSCALKAQVVQQDEREETGLRAMLNYGHTFAHAFEIAAGYGTWLHGEAVSAGMVCAAKLAEELGRVPGAFTARQTNLLEVFGLPTEVLPEWDADEMIATMHRDKKSLAGKLRFVLPSELGKVELVDGIDEAAVRRALGV
jgi:3-dehydroquinate synthase